MSFHFLGKYKFYELENKPRSLKWSTNIWQQFLLDDGKYAPPTLQGIKFSFAMWFQYWLRHRPKVLANLGFGFGRTLDESKD